ncbi:hypothetical protein BDR03DRAFT_855030 [Suillus americanus]|nr:hypothetical protein BDR03DRAFT_855030 [Suillus americanus]
MPPLALSYLHKAGWVHRDFSIGNVTLVVDDNGCIGKLGDFEYAKEINSNASHDVRTGTMHFMAVEVEYQKYIFLPPTSLPPDRTFRGTSLPPRPPFRTNTVGIYFYHADTIIANSDNSFDVHAQWRQFQLAFPGAIGRGTRQNFFTNIRRPANLSFQIYALMFAIIFLILQTLPIERQSPSTLACA